MNLVVFCWTRPVVCGGWAAQRWEMGMEFSCRPWGGRIGGGPSTSVWLAEFCLGVAVWWRGRSRRKSIMQRRVVP